MEIQTIKEMEKVLKEMTVIELKNLKLVQELYALEALLRDILSLIKNTNKPLMLN